MTSVLVADIGGTNARFARVDAGGVHEVRVLTVAGYDGPVAAARAYLDGAGGPPPQKAVFAVAGPVTGADVFSLTNHPWEFSVSGTRAALGLSAFDIINDFHAMALGALHADPATVHQIGGGAPHPGGHIGVLGPGTGLGMASLIWDARDGRYIPLACEGAHVTLPVRADREWAIVKWLLADRYSHVSAERVCSGKGLVNLYDALRGVDGLPPESLPPETITARAMDGSCARCAETLDLMLAFLGRVAGNLALTNNTRGGVFLTGGILPRLGLAHLRASRLHGEFVSKGRFTDYVDAIPLYFVDDPLLALRGLRAHALSL